MKCIAYVRPDGGVSVVHPAPADRRPGESEDDQIAYVTAKDVPAGSIASAVVLDAAALPPRRFRVAWDVSGGVVRVAPARARGQVVAEARARRDLLLKESDGEKARLDDVGTAAQKLALAGYRQQLRDLPAAVMAQIQGLSVAELETFVPAFPAPP